MTDYSPTKRPKPKAKKPEFKCDFCSRAFVRESTLLSHVCEQKRRHVQRNEKPVTFAFIAYQALYKSMGKKPPLYESFAKSKMYVAFVQFGRHVVDLNAVNPLAFIDFLLRMGAPIDHWMSPNLYNTYIRELNKNETPVDALTRNFNLMRQWADENGDDWRNFFRKLDAPLAALWIVNGRISPWILFIATSAHDLMQRFNPEQIALIETSIDPDFWRLKIERHQKDVEMIREELARNGI